MTRPSASDIERKSAKARSAWGGNTHVAKKFVEPRKSTPGVKLGHKQGSKGEEMLAFNLRLAGVGGWTREFRFDPVRRWRLDLAFTLQKLGIEIDGGTWLPGGGRHNRAGGFTKDCEKLNALAIAGWRLLRFTPEMVKSGHALSQIQAALM